MKDFLACLKQFNNKFYIDKAVIEVFDLNSKMLELTELLKILFFEMDFGFVLLNPQGHTHLGLHEHDCFAEFSNVLLDCFYDCVVGFVFEIKLEQQGQVELDFHQE